VIAKPQLEAEAVAAFTLEAGEVVAAIEVQSPVDARASEEPARSLPGHANRCVHWRADTGYGRRKGAVVADQRGAGIRHRVVEVRLSVQFSGEPERPSRRKAGADSPAESVGQTDVVGIAAEDDAAVPGKLDALVDLLTGDGVDAEIQLSGADAFLVVFCGRQLDHGADREGERLLAVFRRDVELAANPEVAQLTVGPALSHERVLVHETAGLILTGEEDRTQVTVDATDDRPGAENLGTVSEADTKGDRPIGDVSEALVVIEVDPVGTD